MGCNHISDRAQVFRRKLHKCIRCQCQCDIFSSHKVCKYFKLLQKFSDALNFYFMNIWFVSFPNFVIWNSFYKLFLVTYYQLNVSKTLHKGIHFHAIDLQEDLTTMYLRRKVLISQRSFCMNNKMLTINSFIVLFYIVLARLACLYKRIVSIIVRNIFILVLMCDYDLCWKLFTVFESIKYPSWESK